jgi:CDP-diacylglycerol--serine O-phosphatidyltransferase
MAKSTKTADNNSLLGLQPKDWFTLANAGFGVLSIWLTFSRLEWVAALALAAAAVADYLDGFVARGSPTGANGFGKQLDSLADAVSFGAAPIVLAFSTGTGVLLLVGAIAFACMGVVRLARFNLQKEKGVYNGLPIPAAALIAAFITLSAPGIVWFALLILAGLMVAPFQLDKF